jgi:CBS domain-containing protein
MLVRDVMDSRPPRVGVETSLRDAAAILAERTGSAVLVVDDHGAIVGIVTEAVLADALALIIHVNEPHREAHRRVLRPPTRPIRTAGRGRHATRPPSRAPQLDS